jgi:phosphoribosylamine--glycine ligase
MSKVLVYGSGGRDHCLTIEYLESPQVDKVYIAPGNPGIDHTPQAKRGRIERIELREFGEVAKFCKENDICLVDVGSENPLDEGLIDALDEAGIPAIGPKKDYTRLENDRAFTDDLLLEIGVPKPEYRVFDDPEEARKYVKNIGYQVVVKANGLAAGKGAIVCDDASDALEAIDTIMVKKQFGKSGDRIVIEERKYGEEISFFVYLDGKQSMPLKMFVQDYKAAFDPDDLVGMFEFHYGLDGKHLRRGIHELKLKLDRSIEKLPGDERIRSIEEVLQKSRRRPMNPNTGGTGCYCPHKLAKPWLINRIIKEIVNPTVNAVYNKLGWHYKGVLYFGLNLDPYDNLDVFEINVRHGDPEWEVLGRKLQTDLFEIAMATWEGRLDEIEQRWNENFYVDVVSMVGKSKDPAGGWYNTYPGRYGKGYKIEGLDDMERGIAIFHSGVDEHPTRGLVTSGGRVLHVIASSQNSLQEATEKAYRNIERIRFLDHNHNNENCIRYRKTIALDIGSLGTTFRQL